MYIVVSYLVYLAISLGVTVWVANTLLVVGFYLINVGYVTLALRTGATLEDARQAIELVCDKIGVVLLVLGIMHFFNLYIFNRLRKRGQERERPARPLPPPPPVPGWVPAGAPVG